MSNSGLGPPGTGTYASNVLNVGDGTWDSQRNTFLLPNLMGLNFEAMQYNGTPFSYSFICLRLANVF